MDFPNLGGAWRLGNPYMGDACVAHTAKPTIP